MTDRYILNAAGEPVPCEDLLLWAAWMEKDGARRVADTTLPDGRRVSTVFLGIDHSFGMSGGVPVLWETMVFSAEAHESTLIPGRRFHESLDQRRWTSRADAEAGHAALVRELGGAQ